jgi:hypothetical protein
MLALEQEIETCLASQPILKDWGSANMETAQKALTECMNCTFNKPEIAESFDPSYGSV